MCSQVLELKKEEAERRKHSTRILVVPYKPYIILLSKANWGGERESPGWEILLERERKREREGEREVKNYKDRKRRGGMRGGVKTERVEMERKRERSEEI